MWTVFGVSLFFIFIFNLYQQGITRTGRGWPWITIMCVAFLIVIEFEYVSYYPIYGLILAELIALGALRLFARS